MLEHLDTLGPWRTDLAAIAGLLLTFAGLGWAATRARLGFHTARGTQPRYEARHWLRGGLNGD